MSLFEAKHVHKRFGDHVVLEEINLSFEENQLSGIMGPNGAGKTTCFNVLTGRYKPNRGQVIFDGRDITGLPPRTIAKLGISRSFQVINVFNEYSALENLLLAVPEVRRLGFNVVHGSQTSGGWIPCYGLEPNYGQMLQCGKGWGFGCGESGGSGICRRHRAGLRL